MIKPRTNTVLLTLYLTFISMSTVYLYGTHNKLALAGILLCMLTAFYFLSVILCFLLKKLDIRFKSADSSGRLQTVIFIIFSALSLAVFLLCLWAAYPGSFETDCITQLKQVVSGSYDDWHPVWHTLVFFTLPYRLTGRAAAVTLFQIIYMSLALGYMSSVIYKHFGIVWSVIAYLYIVLNPFTLYLTVSPVKDVGFATVCLVAMSIAFDSIFDPNRQLGIRIWIKYVFMGFMLASSAIFRHNGILFGAFLLFAMFFAIDRKRWIISLLSTAAFYVLIQGPVFKLVGATHIDSQVIQVVGLPMSIIGNVAKATPELLDEETREFVYTVAPPEMWRERYQRGNFNLIKYGGIYNEEIFNETGAAAIVGMSLRSAAASPQAALESFFSLTDFVYGLDTQDKADIDVCHIDIADNEFGIVYSGNEHIAGMLEKYYRGLKLNGYNFIRKLGFTILIVLTAIAAKCDLKKRKDWKRIFFAFPLLAYDFGTMLLLSGHDARFFFVSFLICPLTFLIIMCDEAVAGK